MAFCMYCGKQLADGEACTCSQSAAQTEPKKGALNLEKKPEEQAAEPMGQPVPPMGQPVPPMGQPSQPMMGQPGQPMMGQPGQPMMGQPGQPMMGQPGQPMMGQPGQPMMGQNPQMQYANNPNQEQFQQTFQQAKQVSGAFLQEFFGAFLTLLKKPVTAGKEFAKTGSMKIGIGFMALQALFSAIFAILSFSKVNKLQKSLLSIWSDDVDSSNLINLPLAFVLTVMGSMIISFVVAGLLYGAYKIAKSEKTFQQAVCTAGVRSFGTAIVIALAVVLSLLSYGWGVVVFLFSWVFGLIFLTRVVDMDETVDADMMHYMIVASTVITLIVFFILIKYGSGLYLPDGSDIMNYLNYLK